MKTENVEAGESVLATEATEMKKASLAAIASYGFLGTVTKRVNFEQPNGRAFATKNDQLTVPSGSVRVRICIRAADVGFGNLSNLSERPLGKLYYEAGITGFSGNLVTFTVTALCRDSNGDDPWWGRFTVELMCFGT